MVAEQRILRGRGQRPTGSYTAPLPRDSTIVASQEWSTASQQVLEQMQAGELEAALETFYRLPEAERMLLSKEWAYMSAATATATNLVRSDNAIAVMNAAGLVEDFRKSTRLFSVHRDEQREKILQDPQYIQASDDLRSLMFQAQQEIIDKYAPGKTPVSCEYVRKEALREARRRLIWQGYAAGRVTEPVQVFSRVDEYGGYFADKKPLLKEPVFDPLHRRGKEWRETISPEALYLWQYQQQELGMKPQGPEVALRDIPLSQQVDHVARSIAEQIPDHKITYTREKLGAHEVMLKLQRPISKREYRWEDRELGWYPPKKDDYDEKEHPTRHDPAMILGGESLPVPVGTEIEFHQHKKSTVSAATIDREHYSVNDLAHADPAHREAAWKHFDPHNHGTVEVIVDTTEPTQVDAATRLHNTWKETVTAHNDTLTQQYQNALHQRAMEAHSGVINKPVSWLAVETEALDQHALAPELTADTFVELLDDL